MSTLVNLTSNTYSVDACVSWGFGDGGFDNFDCCLFTLPVKMKRCKQGFNVYYLGIYTRGQKSTHPKVVINFEKSDLSLKATEMRNTAMERQFYWLSGKF